MSPPKCDYRSIETHLRPFYTHEEQEDFIRKVLAVGGNYVSTVPIPLWGPLGNVVAMHYGVVYQHSSELEIE